MKKLVALISAVFLSLSMTTSVAAGSLPKIEPHSLSACFGNAGVQIEEQDAYACEHKDADEGGTLYFWVDNGAWMYQLHPDSGNFPVWAVFDRTDNSFHATLQDGNGGCEIINPGYDKHPSMCIKNGKAQSMTNTQQASYDDFAEYMGEVIPDNAW